MEVLTLTLNPCVDRTLWPGGRVDSQSGGKGVNVARVLNNLGADCLAVAVAGRRLALKVRKTPYPYLRQTHPIL